MARAAVQVSVRDLATMAGLSSMTVTRFENGHSGGAPDTIAALRGALEKAGVIFVDENGEGPGVRLRKQRVTIDQPSDGEGGIIKNSDM